MVLQFMGPGEVEGACLTAKLIP